MKNSLLITMEWSTVDYMHSKRVKTMFYSIDTRANSNTKVCVWTNLTIQINSPFVSKHESSCIDDWGHLEDGQIDQSLIWSFWGFRSLNPICILRIFKHSQLNCTSMNSAFWSANDAASNDVFKLMLQQTFVVTFCIKFLYKTWCFTFKCICY